nr:MAG TPA: hypothetical protein [Caudoviricetes sp.]
MTNEIDANLYVEMTFTKKIDMTEFQEQTFKVSDIKEAKNNYIQSKFPDRELIKNILLNTQKEIEKLGLKNVKIVSYAKELTPENAFLECLKNKIEESLFKGTINDTEQNAK